MPTCVSNLFGDAYKEPFLFSVKDTCEKINQNDKTATSGKIDVHCGTKLRLEFGDNCQNYNANRFSFSTFDKEDERKTVSYDNITHFLTDAVLETLFRFTVGVTVEKDKGGETVYDWKDIFNVGERHNDEKWSFVVTSSFVKKQKDVLLKKSFLLLKFLSHFSYVYCIGEVLLRQKEKSGHATKLKGHLRFCISDQQMKSIVSICDEKDSNNALCEVYVTDSNAQVEWSSEAGKARRNGSVVDLLNSV
ncbi:hypothetical protein AGDE_13043 [Angomonas deanei]|uniref:Uncharacterized protein n=1 Tax=Angomonas deanei TaxID=59799 RepID=A0A7G2C7D9_9TRYP|nr:hypothetical protein AGDE_13043 [Angomonas deanei]CAD2215740.1 hypothetical protein, conserved [Angomonas deanei]|eukprot:EPY23103.1 hypothetical protein AGDE_13043 [Angomonas deanei]